ncbi:siderophore-interacting protein [Streptomonospora nanhaiensis]|uniref:NADPH-dependent ferric siderophore reductase n=1 Tax=Streptomonospora nanhaiensis TaxID=1323731 RepID=A0A853BH36_9ACTN|nr:siderophore-interacting protein [Streptomonospora nanhaiensis]MBV2363765.1 siderophore-interacting protein [Streptomonospora nanhaiensis]MBX9391878.1 siderophore-interacting protein [Streptomonospora nanhaiensis]NYI93931.1 NADPH-dependent ferric siderophore reductase [Streptomonospora nanhaiensis]
MAVSRDPRVEFYPLRPRVLAVRTAERLTPGLVRVVLGGPDLDGFRTDNFADHVKLFFPDEATGELRMPRLTEDGRADFRDPRLVFRDYTVRRYDPGAGELTIDMVAHEHGPGGRWAVRARPGDRIGVLGPRGTHHMDVGFDYFLIGADETALPAAARWLEELPRTATVLAFLEVADSGEELKLDTPDDTALTWLHRGGAAPGTTDLLERAIRGARLPEGRGFAWCAGEATTLKPIRRHLKERGFERRTGFDVDGYWRRGTSNHDHHADEED